MLLNRTSTMTMRERVGGIWIIVSVNDTEYDHFGVTPAVELVDPDIQTPTHLQSAPLDPASAEAIRDRVERQSGEAPEVVDFQGGKKIIRVSVAAAKKIIESEQDQATTVAGAQTRF